MTIGVTIGMTVGITIGGTIHPLDRLVVRAVGQSANPALHAMERGGNAGRSSSGREKIVVDVLDEDPLALHAR